MSEWKKSEDELPNTNEMVCFWYDKQYHIGYYIERSKHTSEDLWQSHIDGYNCICDVEYWTELPKEPKEETNE